MEKPPHNVPEGNRGTVDYALVSIAISISASNPIAGGCPTLGWSVCGRRLNDLIILFFLHLATAAWLVAGRVLTWTNAFLYSGGCRTQANRHRANMALCSSLNIAAGRPLVEPGAVVDFQERP